MLCTSSGVRPQNEQRIFSGVRLFWLMQSPWVGYFFASRGFFTKTESMRPYVLDSSADM